MSQQLFKNAKQVASPSSNAHQSPNYQFDTHRSFVVSRTTTTNQEYYVQPKRLDYYSNNANMIKSQVVNDSESNVFHNTSQFSGQKSKNDKSQFISSSFINRSTNNGLGNFKSSRVVDPMRESTVSYLKSIYKTIPNLAEDRLKYIADNFMRLYGTNQEITPNGIRNIQKQAHMNEKFQQSQDTVKSLFQVLDTNHDNRITKEDIINLARRYLNFNKKQIFYTPMVEERLAVARRLFKQFDVQRKGYLTEKQVPNLLHETYRCLGKSFTATQEDIKSWMKLTDSDNDGLVTLKEYEYSIIRALKKQGVKIYDDDYQ